jgi:hypothetical protein
MEESEEGGVEVWGDSPISAKTNGCKKTSTLTCFITLPGYI